MEAGGGRRLQYAVNGAVRDLRQAGPRLPPSRVLLRYGINGSSREGGVRDFHQSS